MGMLVHLLGGSTMPDGPAWLTGGPGPHWQQAGDPVTGVVNSPHPWHVAHDPEHISQTVVALRRFGFARGISSGVRGVGPLTLHLNLH
jgi:hypothetical protein